jgi:hypothetical protein
VAASRGWAAGDAAAVREAVDAEMAWAYAAADDAIRQAHAVVSRAKSIQPLSVPVPFFDFRPQVGHIENALNALQRIDYVLEVDMANEGDDIPLDVELMQTPAWIVQEHTAYLSNESRSPTSGTSSPRNAAAAYEEAAAEAFRALLQRIDEVVNIVTAMLADPWVQRAIS